LRSRFVLFHSLPTLPESSPRAPAGFSITPTALLERVRSYVDTNLAEVSKTGWTGFSKTSGLMKATEDLRWVAPLELKSAAESVFETVFGKKEDAKKVAADKADKAKKVHFPFLLFLPHSSLSMIDDDAHFFSLAGSQGFHLFRSRRRCRRISR
jgi:hypothetical protein